MDKKEEISRNSKECTAYLICMNDSVESFVLGDEKLAYIRKDQLKEAYFKHRGNRSSHENNYNWHIREVKGEIPAEIPPKS